MTNAYVVTGTLTDPQTVRLDEPLPLSGGTVRVVIEATPAPAESPKQSLHEYLAGLRQRPAARGHVPRSAEEIRAHIREERASWED
ncbi:hypothetical protein [Frigoriglobus tundricola]|uniref:Uncharacterized protein n=1 Tax=Frigoriglobus tundricola TaxID=2774151 RepID=A0A6M5YK95_9BACT|nr:hypothetical protein [Frigoriglobus tundricola]QJW93721.1 hypothetical protein FTUN_1232 [Frigoriglobus tundricola]